MSAATLQPFPEFYIWGFASAPIQIHLNLEVIRRIRQQMQPSQGANGSLSASGLLVGNTSQPGITRILDFNPLPTLDDASVQAATSGAPAQVVGFYRTIRAGNICLPDEDRALAVARFHDPSSVFLLIETGPTGIGDARFCFWGENELFDWPVMPFPFDADQLSVRERRRRASLVRESSSPAHGGTTLVLPPAEGRASAGPEFEPQPAALAATPLVLPAERLPAPKADHLPESSPAQPSKPRKTGGVWLKALAALVVVGLLVGGFIYFTRGTRPQPAPLVEPSPVAGSANPVKAPLGLAVEKRGNNLLVTWNGNAPIIEKANFGMLLIRGNQVSRDVPLTVEELRAGSVLYAPTADQVRFQLNVVAGEQVAREFLTVILPRGPETPRTLAGAPVANSTAGVPAGAPLQSRASGAPAPTSELKPFKPAPNPDPAASAPQRIEDAPVANTAPAVGSTALSLLKSPPSAIPAPAAPPVAQAPPTPLSPLAVEAYPPVATQKVIPALPALLRGKLWTAAQVDVKVSVDASGNVVKAEALPKPAAHPLLRDAAVQAAQRWRFKSAQFDGHPVPAEMVVQFNFAASR